MEPNNTNNSMPSSKPLNLEPNIAGALAYFLAPLTGVLFFVLEKEDRFVRFHAMQSILFGVASIGLNMVVGFVPILGLLLVPLVSLGSFVLWLLLMWKAYNKQEWELPVLGKIAREQINK